MKKIITICAAILMTASVFLPQQASAQAPEKMSYQAVVRDGSNNLVSSTAVGMRISILQTTPSGTAVYVETQTPTTNANGLVSIEIGGGTVVSGNFATIDWANGPYFIKTETDPAGGTSYSITGTSQLLSVPYALHAKSTDSWSVNGDTVSTMKKVAIGTSSSENLSGMAPAPLRILGESPSDTRIVIDRISPNNGGPVIQLTKSYGSITNPLPVITGNTLGAINFSGYDGINTTTGTGVMLAAIARENQTLNNSGNEFLIKTTPIGTNTNITQLKVTDSGILQVTNNDVYIQNVGSGVIIKSPNGNCWRVTVDNSGNFVSTAITCP